jgi:hypothetical protein
MSFSFPTTAHLGPLWGGSPSCRRPPGRRFPAPPGADQGVGSQARRPAPRKLDDIGLKAYPTRLHRLLPPRLRSREKILPACQEDKPEAYPTLKTVGLQCVRSGTFEFFHSFWGITLLTGVPSARKNRHTCSFSPPNENNRLHTQGAAAQVY